MREPKGRHVAISEPRRFILDMMHFARQVPSIPVGRSMDLAEVAKARAEHPARPSWSLVFMKAYALVCAEHPPLRRALLTFPWTRIYEHPTPNCALALERIHKGEEGIFVGLFRCPEQQTFEQLQSSLREYKDWPIEKLGYFRQALRVSRYPTPLRRVLWWSTLHVSGWKRAKRFGTFGLSSYGSLGAESFHPISPLTTTLTYGPIDALGRVMVKLIYDHRVLDGAYIARCLADVESTLRGPILAELRRPLEAGRARLPHTATGKLRNRQEGATP